MRSGKPDAWDQALASTAPMSEATKMQAQRISVRGQHPCPRCRKLTTVGEYCSGGCSKVAKARMRRGAPVADPPAPAARCGRCNQALPLQLLHRLPLERRALRCDACWRAWVNGVAGAGDLQPAELAATTEKEPAIVPMQCAWCGQPYTVKRFARTFRYCSKKCSQAGWRKANGRPKERSRKDRQPRKAVA